MKPEITIELDTKLHIIDKGGKHTVGQISTIQHLSFLLTAIENASISEILIALIKEHKGAISHIPVGSEAHNLIKDAHKKLREKD